MTDKHIGRRMQRHKAKKKAFLFSIINLFLILALIVGGIYLWKTQFSPNKQSSAGNQTVQSSPKSDTSATNDEASKIKWVKQDEPVKIPILMYHAIHVMDPSEAANAGLIVDPTTFESHLQALKEAGYYTLTPDEAYKALTENVLPENKKVVWLTFDDSLKDFYTNAFPLLQKYQMKATNNVITGFVQAGKP